MRLGLLLFLTIGLLSPTLLAAEQPVNGRESLVLESANVRLVVDLAGGAIGEFRYKDGELNPLSWAAPKPGETAIRGFGHFLCLDRWGPPSDAEGKAGMPYHGEASNVRWTVKNGSGAQEGVMSARLPMAGLGIQRTIRISPNEALFTVDEEVTNENKLGRLFNMVQHPTIAPPFLDESTVVDCNGRRGFAQGGSMPDPEKPSAKWPEALKSSGQSVDLRYLGADPDPNVVSYEIEEPYGWVTAVNARRGLLIGYVWRSTQYPWVSLWRDVRDGKPAARGLEFGTTGLHQPYPVLVKKGRIWGRQLFEYVDAGESRGKQYACFLLKVPADFSGVDSVRVQTDRIEVRQRGRPDRVLTVSTAGMVLFPGLQ